MSSPFRLGGGVAIIPLAEMLGPDEEDKVVLHVEDRVLRVAIDYFCDELNANRTIALVFDSTVHHLYHCFPQFTMGLYDPMESVRPPSFYFGDVFEYTISELADAWSQQFNQTIRHFGVRFMSMEMALEVFAADCRLET